MKGSFLAADLHGWARIVIVMKFGVSVFGEVPGSGLGEDKEKESRRCTQMNADRR
jgi:hypothetical protein